MAIFEKEYRVSVCHVSPSALITNIGILSILEDIACRHSDTVGFGILDIPKTHLSWMLLAWKVKVLKRVPYNTKLRVCTWAKNANKFNTYRDFEMYDDENNLVCIATSKWTLVDIPNGSITKITDDIIEKYNPTNKDVFESSKINKLKEPTYFSNEYIYNVQRKDIDINKHMHNLNYLSLAYETLPEEIYNSNEFNNIEIMYRKGIKLRNTVKCLYSFFENNHYITIKSNDEKVLHSIIKLS